MVANIARAQRCGRAYDLGIDAAFGNHLLQQLSALSAEMAHAADATGSGELFVTD